MNPISAKFFQILGVFLWGGFIATACGYYESEVPQGRFTDDDIPLAELPWPTEPDALPSCDGPFGDFTTPDLLSPEGDILILPSALLTPVGVEERMRVMVYLPNTTELDPYAFGELTVDAGPNAEIISAEPVENGIASLIMRFAAAGTYTVTASLSDEKVERKGSMEIVAYDPQLPVYEMTIAEGDFQEILSKPHERILVPASLTVDGETFGTSVRIHGGASRDYPKKSFRFDLDDGLELLDGRDHIILRAEWNDKSLLRNYLGLEILRNGTWLFAPFAEPVHFRINREYYGVMWRTERIDGDFLRFRELNNKTGSLYEADPIAECRADGADLAPLSDMDTYRCVYALQKGVEDYADLVDLIENTLTLPTWDFQPIINDIVRVNDMLVYYAAMAVIQSRDHLKKNYYLFRDPESEDDRWTVFPWDLDLTLGHLWTYQSDTLDETIFTDAALDFGVCPGFCNVLFSKLMEVVTYRERFFEMVNRITESTFTEKFIDERIDNFLCRAEPDILADTRKRATEDEYLERVDEIRSFVKERRSFIFSNNP